MNPPLRAVTFALLAALSFGQVGGARPPQKISSRSAGALAASPVEIVFAKRAPMGAAIYGLAAGGGEPKRLTSPRRVSWRCRCRSGDFDDHPAWSPDGSRIAFTRGAGVYVMSPDGSGARRIAASPAAEDYDFAWSPNGSIAFVRNRPGENGYVEEILAARPQVGAVRVLTPISRLGYQDPVWSPDGRRLAYLRGIVRRNIGGAIGLFVVSAHGGKSALAVSAASIASPVWAPDGSKLAFVAQPTPYDAADLFVIEPRGGGVTQLTRILGYGRGVYGPSWSPDGDRILFTHAKKSALFLEDGPSIFTISPDGRRRARLAENAWALGWSPDGREILLLDHYVADGHPLSLSVMRPAGGAKRVLATLDRALDGLWQAPPSWRPRGSAR